MIHQIKSEEEPKPRFPLIFFLICALLPGFLWAKDTELKLYRPFLVDKARQISTLASLQGDCWQQSLRIKREDAWRCTVKEQIFDPCFINMQGNQNIALCPEAPWNAKSVKLLLQNRPNNAMTDSLDMSRTYPWAVELAGGEKCLALEEGTYFDNAPVRYQCDNESQLFGALQRCKTPWTILQRKGALVETVVIEKAWF